MITDAILTSEPPLKIQGIEPATFDNLPVDKLAEILVYLPLSQQIEPICKKWRFAFFLTPDFSTSHEVSLDTEHYRYMLNALPRVHLLFMQDRITKLELHNISVPRQGGGDPLFRWVDSTTFSKALRMSTNLKHLTLTVDVLGPELRGNLLSCNHSLQVLDLTAQTIEFDEDALFFEGLAIEELRLKIAASDGVLIYDLPGEESDFLATLNTLLREVCHPSSSIRRLILEFNDVGETLLALQTPIVELLKQHIPASKVSFLEVRLGVIPQEADNLTPTRHKIITLDNLQEE